MDGGDQNNFKCGKKMFLAADWQNKIPGPVRKSQQS